MAKATVKTESVDTAENVNLTKFLSVKPTFKKFSLWLVGDAPLITHAWSQKARLEMLQKQVKSAKAGRDARDPHSDFISSLYQFGDGSHGFPAMGVKNCILSAAHKDKGIPRSVVQSALWLYAPIVRLDTALGDAICDMPLLKIYGSEPEMREDMVKIGSGLNKTASLAYRGQFTTWAMKIEGKFNASVLSDEVLLYLLEECGHATGIGEWRNEKKGVFGSFHVANAQETDAWDAFAAGKGPMPQVNSALV